jgi:Uma2 family endonuclease
MTQAAAPPVLEKEERWTYARYLRETAAGEYFTIIAGEKIVSPSPTDFHQVVFGNLHLLLGPWVRSSGIGKIRIAPYDVILDEEVVVQPDLVIVLNEHLTRITPKNLRGAPDLVIEIVSPGSTRLDRVKKREVYAQYGILEYWIVSPGERTVEILRLRDGQYEQAGLYEEGDALQSPLLTGFTCPVKDIFAEF